MSRFRVGIDIGGTNTVFGLVDHIGNCISHDSIKTSHFQLVEDFVDAVCLKLNKLINLLRLSFLMLKS